MSPEMKSQLRHLLIIHEGYKLHPYTDTMGHISIGIGRNLDSRGVLPTEIDMMCEHDMQYFYDQIDSHFTWFAKLNTARQIALIDMCFMGFKKFITFEKMLIALQKEDYETAANEILNSEYATQVGQRAKDLADIIRRGQILS